MDIKQLLITQKQVYGQKPAFIFANQPVTFGQLAERAFQAADCLATAGIRQGEKCAVFLPNIPEAVYSILGILSSGFSLVPLDFMLTEEEVVHFINHSEAKALIMQAKKEVNAAKIKARCSGLKKIILINGEAAGFTSWSAAQSAGSQPPRGQASENDLAAIFYTSGSTGQPKGVCLEYRHLDSPVRCIKHFLNVSERDSYLCGGVPFSHLGGLDYLLFMVFFGSTLVLMDRFHPLEFLRQARQNKVSIFCIVPAMFTAILFLKAQENFNLPDLRYAVVFGAPSSPQLLQRFQHICPQAILLNGWGMTETSAPNAYSPKDAAKVGSIGKFDFELQARIVDDAGVPAQQGELWVKGAGVMRGYYRDEVLTKETVTGDGWLKTGDVVRRDGDGLYYIVGRKKDMIKVAGEIVFSPEVEEKIQLYPKVREVAVIGVADNLRGEVPKAFIVAKENEQIDSRELKEFLRGHMANFKIPHYFEMVSDLPKNKTGKIDKTKLISQ